MTRPIEFISHVPLHPDGRSPINRVKRFEHEHYLADYDWDEKTGVATLAYETEETAYFAAPVYRYVQQPTNPRHAGWRSRR